MSDDGLGPKGREEGAAQGLADEEEATERWQVLFDESAKDHCHYLQGQ